MMNRSISRREFARDLALFSAIGVAPHFLTRTVEGAAQSIRGFKDDKVLVVVQLGGGNDGLNTLVPYSDDAYHRSRPRLALKNDRVLKLNDDIGFNSQFKGLMELFDDGKLAIVQGVGYPNPDRSHFRSMEIWHTAADSDEFMTKGWIGQYFDHHCSGSAKPQVGVALGKERPQAFQGEQGLGIAFEDPRSFGWRAGNNGATQAKFERLNAPNTKQGGEIDFLRQVTSRAIMSSGEVNEAARKANLNFRGRSSVQRSLDVVAGLISTDLDTRIYYLSASGFDTHANQAGQHDALLEMVGDGLKSFQDRLKSLGLEDRVMTMVFSEFGRRVGENYSGGTDHGTAAPMFLIGDAVNAGLHGKAPSLTKLDEGDLIHTTDFRGVYASVLKQWFNVDPATVLGRHFAPLDLIV